jgi:hypothetical protein
MRAVSRKSRGNALLKSAPDEFGYGQALGFGCSTDLLPHADRRSGRDRVRISRLRIGDGDETHSRAPQIIAGTTTREIAG